MEVQKGVVGKLFATKLTFPILFVIVFYYLGQVVYLWKF